MRRNPTKNIERDRITSGAYKSDSSYGANGAFLLSYNGVTLKVMASDGSDWEECGFPLPKWEHVSVSVASRCPTWEEMDFVKRIFWRDDETVIQLHVPRENHINFAETCLHLWKPVGIEIPLPPTATVGPTRADVARQIPY